MRRNKDKSVNMRRTKKGGTLGKGEEKDELKEGRKVGARKQRQKGGTEVGIRKIKNESKRGATVAVRK